MVLAVKRDPLDRVPAVLALAGAIAVTLAVIRQVGFFSQIEPKLLSLLTLEDMVQNSLYALPFALFGLLINAFATARQVVLAVSSEPEGKSRSWLASLLERTPPLGKASAIFVAVLSILALITSTDWPSTWTLFLLVFFVPILALTHKARVVAGVRYRVPTMALALIAAYFFLSGMSEARRDGPPDFMLVTKSWNKEVTLLRSGSDYVIVRLDDGRVDAVAKAEVRELLRLKPIEHRPLWPIDDTLGQIASWFGERWKAVFPPPAPEPARPSTSP
jgi:hypothetical protein